METKLNWNIFLMSFVPSSCGVESMRVKISLQVRWLRDRREPFWLVSRSLSGNKPSLWPRSLSDLFPPLESVRLGQSESFRQESVLQICFQVWTKTSGFCVHSQKPWDLGDVWDPPFPQTPVSRILSITAQPPGTRAHSAAICPWELLSSFAGWPWAPWVRFHSLHFLFCKWDSSRMVGRIAEV